MNLKLGKVFETLRHMRSILFLAPLFFSTILFAQDSSWKKTIDSGSVIVYKDARLDLLVKKQAQINEETSRDARKVGKGYRLMIINTNKRDEAIAAKTKVYTYFPELKAYLIYQSPFFRLKAGNFKTRDEAEKYRKQMAPLFPKGVFIVNDIIEVKAEKTEEE